MPKRPVRHPISVCQDKTRFLGQSEAAERAEQMGLTFYRCAICQGFHLTSNVTRATTNEQLGTEKPEVGFELGLRVRARPRQKGMPPRETEGVCLGRAKPDGSVHARVGSAEVRTAPVQPQQLRSLMAAGVHVTLRRRGDQWHVASVL